MGSDDVYEPDFRCNLHFKTFPVDLEGSRGQVWGPGGRTSAFNLELRIEVVSESLVHGPTVLMLLICQACELSTVVLNLGHPAAVKHGLNRHAPLSPRGHPLKSPSGDKKAQTEEEVASLA